MLKIGENYFFEDDWTDRKSSLMFYDKEDGQFAWDLAIGFADGDFEGEIVSPSLCINPIGTDRNSVEELVGEHFSVKSVELSDEREDSFYIFEHEPMVSYDVSVLEIRDNKAHIKCSGILIVDGYAQPFEQEKFDIDSWVPVIENVSDWEKFNL